MAQLIQHVDARLADFLARKIIGAHHFIADVTLPYGRVPYDYTKEQSSVPRGGTKDFWAAEQGILSFKIGTMRSREAFLERTIERQ